MQSLQLTSSASFASRRHLKAFSLIELLAVIALIAILLTIGAVGLQNVGKAQGTTAGVSIAEALIEEARTIAISRRTTTRLVVNNDSSVANSSDTSERAKYLRQMMILYMENGDWVRSSRATQLPDRVFFDTRHSRQDHTSSGAAMPTADHILDGGTGASPVSCLYYEFNSEGILQATNSNASFVCVEATLAGGDLQGPRDNISGFIVWRNGRTSLFRSPDHITQN